MMRTRNDVRFWLLTMRAERIEHCLPPDRGDGYDHVPVNITVENQKRADERFPILLNLPAKHKGTMAAPMIGPIEIEPYLASGQIESMLCDGENDAGARSLHYEWVKSLVRHAV